MSTASPSEKSHPLLWTAGLASAALGLTWIFAHWFGVGARHAGAPVALSAPAAVPDHRALIADRSPAVIDLGRQLYAKNCASCHGPNGDTNASGSNPPPRNLRSEGFQAPWGGGPYGLYLTLSKGYGQGMPGFAGLDPAQRHAVAHFVRETMVKGGAHYVAEDPEAVAAQIPKPGGAAEAPRIPPELVEQPRHLHPLMAAVAAGESRRIEGLNAWIAAIAAAAGPDERPLVARIRLAGERRPGWLAGLAAAAAGPDPARVAAQLAAPVSGDPALALAPAGSVAIIVRLMQNAPPPKGP